MSGSRELKKIGIYGGTFNPIHYGHLINIEMVRDKFGLDKIFFVPARIPVHKDIANEISPDDRFNMVRKAVENNDYFDISRVELDRKSPSYTVLTLDYFKKQYPYSEIYLIMGIDSFMTIRSWKSHEEILSLGRLIVMARKGYDDIAENGLDCLNVNFFNNPVIDISSTMIRERVMCNRSIRYMTPDPVIEYIYKMELYSN